jgi:asparagine synthase (glutamine-hydrolysing)
VNLLPVSHANMSLDFKLRRTLMGLSYPEHVRLPVWMSPLDPQGLSELFETPVDVEDVYEEAIAVWERDPRKSTIDRALEFYTQFYLQDDILTKSDRASMMCSLETRAVFLDNDLVDFCQRLPARFKYRNGERKYLLKKVARSLLPTEIVDRKKKGFGIPLGAWMRQGELSPAFEAVEGVRTGFAERLYGEHRRGAHDHRLFLWSWLSTQAFAAGLPSPQASDRRTRAVRAA